MKKIIIGGTLSFLILLGILLAFDNHEIGSAKSQTTQSNFSENLRETNYLSKVEKKLKEQGYNVKYINVSSIPNKPNTATITIPNNEYRGKQTDTNITEIVNQIAKENDIGLFEVKIVKK